MRAVLLLLLATGCEDLLAPTDDTGISLGGTGDSSGDSACQAGWVEPSTISVNVRNLALNTQSLAAAFLDQPYGDTPPACIANNGSKLRILLGLSGEPYGWLESSADGEVETTLVDASGVSMELFGAESEATFSSADWSQGTWLIEDEDPGWRHTINGQGLSDLNSLVVFIEIEVTP